MQAVETQSGVKNRWLILSVILIPVFIGSLDLTIVSAFLPELIFDLGLPLQTGLDDTAWILTAYLLAYTVGMTITGRVSDLIGRRPVYALSLLLFIVGSVFVATAHQWPAETLYNLYRRAGERPDPAMVELQALIFGRAVQALGAGALVPVSLALVSDMFPKARRAQPLGLVGAVDTLGWVLGHLYGGVMVNLFAYNSQWFVDFFASLGLDWGAPDWRALFWLNVPLTLFALVVTLWATRKVPMWRAKGGFDFPGAFFIVTALIALNVGLGANIDPNAGAAGFDELSQLPPYAGPLVAVSIIAFLLFVLVESRVRNPLFDLRMFRQRNLSAGLLTNLFVGYTLFIGLVIVPILVNVRLESTDQLRDAALEVGYLLSALTVPMALAAVPGGWLSDRIGYRTTIVGGLALSAVGFVMIFLTWDMQVSTALVAAEMALVGVGIGLTFSPVSAAVINAADDDRRGAASALVIILRLVGMTVSVSSLTTLALNRVTSLAADALGTGTIDPEVYQNTYARITVDVLGEMGLLGGVLCVVAILPALMIQRESEPPASPPDDRSSAFPDEVEPEHVAVTL